MKRLLFLLPLLFACSSGDDFEGTCEVNETQVCACPGGAMGAQTCLADRSAWGKCECAAGMAGSGGGAGTANVGEAGAMNAKECEEDRDCPTTEKPWCLEYKCIGTVTNPYLGSCKERYEACEVGSTCFNGEWDTSHGGPDYSWTCL